MINSTFEPCFEPNFISYHTILFNKLSLGSEYLLMFRFHFEMFDCFSSEEVNEHKDCSWLRLIKKNYENHKCFWPFVQKN